MEEKKLKIAVISCFSDPLAPVGGRQVGGASIYINELTKNLSRQNVSVDVFTRWDNRRADPTVRMFKQAKLIRLKAGPRNFVPQEDYASYLPEFIENFLKYCREKKINYDLIHTHQYASGLIGLRLKHILKIPMVHTFHSLGKIKFQATGNDKNFNVSHERILVEEKIIESAEKIIATSPQEKINIINLYNKKAKNIDVIPAGVNTRRFFQMPKEVARKKLSLSGTKKIVVFAARMDENKGLSVFVDAISKIKINYPKVYANLEVFAFAGDPRKERRKEKIEESYKKKVIAEINDKKIKDQFHLHSAIDQEKLHYFYCAANVVAMPTFYESFGLVSAEAMACGTPVVASDVGGLKQIIQNDITGYRVPAKNSKELAAKIIKILNSEKLEDRLSENAVAFINENYDWREIVGKIKATYWKLIKKDDDLI